MSKANVLVGLLAFFIGWLFIAFVVGTPIGLNAILLAAVLLIVVLVLRSLDRAEGLYIVVGFAIGALVSFLVPALAPKFVDPAVAFAVLLFAVYKV